MTAVISYARVVLPPAILTAELVEFMESGISLLIATRNADLRPTGRRAFGAQISAANGTATVFLPACGAEATLANLAHNGQVAATFARPMDSRALQLKGKCSSVQATSSAERAIQDRYFAAFAEGLRLLGQQPAALRRVRYFPSYAITFRIESMFEQTPGPDAGRGLELRLE